MKPKFKPGDVICRTNGRMVNIELVLNVDLEKNADPGGTKGVYAVFSTEYSKSKIGAVHDFSIEVTDIDLIFEISNNRKIINEIKRKYKIYQLTTIVEK